ncbi:helix-turn-helix domain-containing protein [Merdimmobilis hominis]|uniref:HTH-type transcriptional regulator ImmR n=1 Tax=uncultured Anaerotruncus sp. TaxID=905011 RepID=A0A6N2UFY0_9FIRM|nr:helix-turn-helix transcriptional regulator [Merdimmobilis hominis]PWL56856.1 MAG: XRE family transcriptional regulator [Oscillospiraceae bacterium]
MEIFDFGLRLRELREKKRLSQQQLADWLGLTRSSISNYENNTQTPPADTLVRLADIYGVSVDYLLGVKNDRKRVLVIEGLTPSQEKALEILAEEFREANSKSIQR